MGNVHMEATQINYRGGASKMNVEDAIKSAIELTPEQKTNINKIPTIEAAVATKTDQTVIAPEFDSESGIYAIGDLVMYEGKLYEFTSAHETAGDWNSEEVTEKTVADEIGDVKSGLTNVNTTLANCAKAEALFLNPSATYSISLSRSRIYYIRTTSRNSAVEYTHYEEFVTYDSGWKILEVNKIEEGSYTSLSFTISDDTLIITNTGNWGITFLCETISSQVVN